MMTHDEIIAVVTAHRDGAEVEYHSHGGKWRSVNSPLWEFAACNYRVKPEPITCWANFYPSGEFYSFKTKAEADEAATNRRIRCVKMIEAEDQS